MDNILSRKTLFGQYFRDNTEDGLKNDDGANLIALAEDTLHKNRMLHYEILKLSSNDKQMKDVCSVVSSCEEYCNLSKKILLNNPMLKTSSKQNNILLQGGAIVNSPLEHFRIICDSWNSFMEVNTVKAFFSIIGAIWVMLFGDITDLLMTTYLLIALYFVVTTFFNGVTFTNVWMNIKSFLMTLVWLIVANLVTSLIQIKALPDEALHSAVLLWIIYAEIKGIAENCQTHGHSVPVPLKNLLKM